MTDSRSTLDDEVDDEPAGDSRETCRFWDSRAGECCPGAELTIGEPCADCPDALPEPHASELNPPPGEPPLSGYCRAGNCRACIGPPGDLCACSCHAVSRLAPGKRVRRPAYLDNPRAVGARPSARWGYLPCGCENDGFGNHASYRR